VCLQLGHECPEIAGVATSASITEAASPRQSMSLPEHRCMANPLLLETSHTSSPVVPRRFNKGEAICKTPTSV
jgi:hypothetical protein